MALGKGAYPWQRKKEQYEGYSDAQLEYAARDAHEAAKASRGWNPDAEGWYMDDVSTIRSEIKRRGGAAKKNGKAPKLEDLVSWGHKVLMGEKAIKKAEQRGWHLFYNGTDITEDEADNLSLAERKKVYAVYATGESETAHYSGYTRENRARRNPGEYSLQRDKYGNMFVGKGTYARNGYQVLLKGTYKDCMEAKSRAKRNPLDSRRKAQILKERKLKPADLFAAGNADLLLIIKKSGSGPAAKAAQAEIERRAAKKGTRAKTNPEVHPGDPNWERAQTMRAVRAGFQGHYPYHTDDLSHISTKRLLELGKSAGGYPVARELNKRLRGVSSSRDKQLGRKLDKSLEELEELYAKDIDAGYGFYGSIYDDPNDPYNPYDDYDSLVDDYDSEVDDLGRDWEFNVGPEGYRTREGRISKPGTGKSIRSKPIVQRDFQNEDDYWRVKGRR